jgi:hypothetical protein
LLLCWIAVGNVYPICRERDYRRSGGPCKFYDEESGIALKPCFDSHCVCISAKHYQAADFDPSNKDNPFGDAVFDEIVVKESSQCFLIVLCTSKNKTVIFYLCSFITFYKYNGSRGRCSTHWAHPMMQKLRNMTPLQSFSHSFANYTFFLNLGWCSRSLIPNN